jgi:hypothetical protein
MNIEGMFVTLLYGLLKFIIFLWVLVPAIAASCAAIQAFDEKDEFVKNLNFRINGDWMSPVSFPRKFSECLEYSLIEWVGAQLIVPLSAGLRVWGMTTILPLLFLWSTFASIFTSFKELEKPPW